VDRRRFVGAALAAGVAAGAARRVRIAFLGGSHSHARGKVEVVSKLPDYELAGMWEPDLALMEGYQARGIKRLSLDDLLEDESVEVIVVESDIPDHAHHARLALEAGKHVHIEKPPALTLEDFRRLLRLAAQKKRLVQVGYMWRYHPGINAIFEAVAKGWLGDVYLVHAVINKSLDPARRPTWARFRGGQMFELGCHVIDPLVRLLGRPNRVTPYLKKHGDYDDNLADNTLAVFEYSKAMGVVMGTALQPNSGRYRTFAVFGANGTATLRPIEPPVLEIDLKRAAGPYPAGPQRVKLPPYERFVDDFIELAAAVRGERTLRVSAAEDLLVQEALLKASGM